MKKKTNIRTMIRTIVREEVAMAIGEVVNELKQPPLSSKSSQQVSKPKPKKKIIEKKQYTKNSILNEVMNETAMADEWKTMGGGTYDSSKMNDVVSSQYSDLMNGNQSGEDMITSMGVSPDAVDDSIKDALNRDYSKLVKKMNEQPRGKIKK